MEVDVGYLLSSEWDGCRYSELALSARPPALSSNARSSWPELDVNISVEHIGPTSAETEIRGSASGGVVSGVARAGLEDCLSRSIELSSSCR